MSLDDSTNCRRPLLWAPVSPSFSEMSRLNYIEFWQDIGQSSAFREFGAPFRLKGELG